MPASVTSTQVRAVYQEIPSDKDISAFILTALLVVDETLDGQGLSQARLDQIATYLAAHLVAQDLERGGLTRSKDGESEDDYASYGSKALGYASTRWGQTAIALDTTGKLEATSPGKRKALFRVV